MSIEDVPSITHVHSQQKKLQHRLKWEQQQFANRITLDFSYHDLINGEIVYTVEHSPIVANQLKQVFGYIQECAVNHEFGDVLNRFQKVVEVNNRTC